MRTGSAILIFVFLWLYQEGWAQMRAPESWLNYESVLGVEYNERSYDYDVFCIKSSAPSNIFWPGDSALFTFQLVNQTGQFISMDASVELISYGTVGIPNDIWLPEMQKFGEIESIPVKIEIQPHGFLNLDLAPDLPERFGAYALVFDLGVHGRRLATSVVRTFRANPRTIQYPKQSLDDLGPEFLNRIGVQAIRMGVPYIPTTHRDYISEMEKLDRKLRAYKDKDITVLLMFGEGPALVPLGTPRSFLDRNGIFLKTKQDYVWLPQMDADFRTFVKNIAIKHGWPAGCVTGVHLWNEPWEGISISGWQSDMLRYREIYKAMAGGILDARKEGADVLIGGCDSNSNAWDKLFSDGTDEFLPIFDFLSIHYQGMESPCLYPQWNQRKDHKGAVRIWDTESWVGNTDDRIATVVATNRSAGYDRSMGIYGGYMISHPQAGKEAIPLVWSPAAAMAAVQHMLGEREFDGLLFKKGLPWVMCFGGLPDNPDDATIVVIGDIGEAFGSGNVLYRGVRLEKSGKMLLKSHPSFSLYDFYGNQIPSVHGMIEIPLSFQGYYLRTDGSRGSYSRLKSALEKAEILGYDPVEIIAKDMLGPINNKPVLELQLSNILNRPVSGTLEVRLAGKPLEGPGRLLLKPHEIRIVQLLADDLESSPDNNYLLDVLFDAGKDGRAEHQEAMHVNTITRMTPMIDGSITDWGTCLPQTLSAGKSSLTTTEAAWYPFKDFDEKAEGTATGYLAYDDEYFYFAAKVADRSPHPGTYRFENRNDDEFFYPDTAYKPDFNLSFRKTDGQRQVGVHEQWALQNPEGPGRLMHYWEPDQHHIGMGVDLKLPVERFTQVSFYLPDMDTWGTQVEIRDLQTGGLLSSNKVDKLWGGCYLVYRLSGDVRVTFKGNWWYNVKLAGLFIDKSDKPAFGTSAELINEDYDTGGDWKGLYGNIGYWVFGSQASLPVDISVEPTDQQVLIPLVWPEGVRHFTYRKDPVLPDNSTGMGFATDNVQIAFNVIPMGEDGYGTTPPGTMPRYAGYKCTDYEYALNQVAPEYGGGTEIWRLLVPGMPEKHFYPRQPKSPFDGPVRDGKLVITHEENTRITECAIPWSELPHVKDALTEGRTIKFSFRVNDNTNMGRCMELARDRSVSKMNSRAFHASWKEHWANEVVFGFEKK